MKKLWTVLGCALSVSLYITSANADEYTDAYNCWMEGLAEGYDGGAVPYCVGNAYDPSELQLKAYADAERAFNSTKATGLTNCPFEFGVWIASGSRADGFIEGVQLIDTLDEAASVVESGRDVFLYDVDGNKLSDTITRLCLSKK